MFMYVGCCSCNGTQSGCGGCATQREGGSPCACTCVFHCSTIIFGVVVNVIIIVLVVGVDRAAVDWQVYVGNGVVAVCILVYVYIYVVHIYM